MKMHFTKMLSVCCAILFGAFMATDLNAQCLTASEGQFPSATFTPACDQTAESITDFAWTDEYSVVEVSVGTEYTFASSVSTHLVTISADGGATEAASGTGSVVWTAPAGGTVRFYTHLSSACDGEQVSHTRSVSCALAACPDGSFPGDTCDDGDPTTIDDTVQGDCACEGIPAAQNDTPCTATALACGDTLLDQTILGATAFGTDDCFGSATADVYYSFTADGTQTYRVAVLDPSFVFDGVVELLEGPDCNSLSVVGACDDFPEEFTVTEAGNYIFRVRAFSDTEEDFFNVTLECTPFDCPGVGNIGDACDDGNGGTVNDAIQEDCSCAGEATATNNRPCTATALICGDTLTGQSLAGATAFGSDDCFGTGEADVYYSFTADGAQTYEVAVLDPDFVFDGVVELLEGPSCVSLTVAGACDDFPESFTITDAGNYYFRVRAFSSTEADGFDIALTCTPFDCPGVGNIGDTCDDGDADTFDDEIQADCSCAGTPVDCPGLGNIGDACDDGNPISINDVVQSDCTCAGLLPATNDTPCTAAVLDCGDTITGESLAAATASSVSGCAIAQDLDLWYSVSVPDTARFEQLDNGDFMDAFIEVYAVNSSCTDLDTLITCQDFDDDFLDGVNLSAGDYLIRILGETAGDVDNVFDVTLDCFEPDCPDGSDFGDACDDGVAGTVNDVVQEDCSCAGIPLATNDTPCTSALLACGDTLSDQNVVAATAFGTDDCGGTGTADLYYAFIADGTQAYTVSIVDPGFDFDGVVSLSRVLTSCNNLEEVEACSDFPEEFTVTEAGTYIFRVRAFSEAEEDPFGVSVICSEFECPGLGNVGSPCDDGDPTTENDVVQEDCSCLGVVPLPNDDCSDVNAQFLLQCGDTIFGSTEGALPATNSPTGCGFSPFDTFDVWYAFQADGSSSYTVTVAAGETSTAWDGVLYVYSGSCGNLVEVSCSDDTFGGGTEAVALDTPAAGVYYVQFYDFGGTDTYEVSLECDDNCSDPFPAIDPASISTTFTGSSYLVEWDPVPGQTGCQVQVREAGAPVLLGARIVPGAGASSFVIPGGVLDLGTPYQWRVRCGCSAGPPIIAGPFSVWQLFTTPGGSAITSLPNPTEGQSNVTFTVAETGYTTLEVFDMSGRLIDGLFSGNAQADNEYRFEFDGSSLPNGVYIYRLTTENEVINDKFMIAR